MDWTAQCQQTEVLQTHPLTSLLHSPSQHKLRQPPHLATSYFAPGWSTFRWLCKFNPPNTHQTTAAKSGGSAREDLGLQGGWQEVFWWQQMVTLVINLTKLGTAEAPSLFCPQLLSQHEGRDGNKQSEAEATGMAARRGKQTILEKWWWKEARTKLHITCWENREGLDIHYLFQCKIQLPPSKANNLKDSLLKDTADTQFGGPWWETRQTFGTDLHFPWDLCCTIKFPSQNYNKNQQGHIICKQLVQTGTFQMSHLQITPK